jgi:hypothetical protein
VNAWMPWHPSAGAVLRVTALAKRCSVDVPSCAGVVAEPPLRRMDSEPTELVRGEPVGVVRVTLAADRAAEGDHRILLARCARPAGCQAYRQTVHADSPHELADAIGGATAGGRPEV